MFSAFILMVGQIGFSENSRMSEPNLSNPVIANVAAATVKFVVLSELQRDAEGNIITQSEEKVSCPKQGIRPQGSPPSAPECSGCLIKPNVILTANHCIIGDLCNRDGFIFNLTPDVQKVSPDKLHRCSRVIKGDQVNGLGDTAAIVLTAPITDIKPIPYRRSGTPKIGDQIVALGYPAPFQMLMTEGQITDVNVASGSMVSTLYGQGGFSGGCAFNKTTGLVEGVMSGGGRSTVAPMKIQKGAQLKSKNLCNGIIGPSYDGLNMSFQPSLKHPGEFDYFGYFLSSPLRVSQQISNIPDTLPTSAPESRRPTRQ